MNRSPDTDKNFAGSIPRLYEEHLVPLIFAPYAEDIADRVASRKPRRLLEIAAGTGVVTCRNEIEARDKSRLAEATDCANDAIARLFGPGPVGDRIQAIVVVAER